ncbi:hypothetical protein ILUMI_16189, partial [Ignelater luminosus]
NSRVLFGICSCKYKEIELCCCPRENKVPKEEQKFLLDQRQARKMQIGGIDRVLTVKLQNKFIRASKDLVSSSSDSKSNISSPDKLNSPSTSQINKKLTKSVKSLPMLTRTYERYGISDRAAAATVSSKGANRYNQTVITTVQGTAKSIEASINALLGSQRIKLDDLIAVGCDEVKFEDLSRDQKYLYKITMSVITGQCHDDLANRSPGWLTKPNRILRLDISTSNHSNELKLLAEYCVKVYALVWFQIKTNPTCKDVPKYFWKLIKSSECKLIVDPVIERNAYFAHLETLLLLMLSDENRTLRELAAKRILQARSSPHSGKGARIVCEDDVKMSYQIVRLKIVFETFISGNTSLQMRPQTARPSVVDQKALKHLQLQAPKSYQRSLDHPEG